MSDSLLNSLHPTIHRFLSPKKKKVDKKTHSDDLQENLIYS